MIVVILREAKWYSYVDRTVVIDISPKSKLGSISLITFVVTSTPDLFSSFFRELHKSLLNFNTFSGEVQMTATFSIFEVKSIYPVVLIVEAHWTNPNKASKINVFFIIFFIS